MGVPSENKTHYTVVMGKYTSSLTITSRQSAWKVMLVVFWLILFLAQGHNYEDKTHYSVVMGHYTSSLAITSRQGDCKDMLVVIY